MTVVDKDLNRNRRVARCFGARAGAYEDHADLQRRIAAKLATLLPSCEAPSVLEVGCGTGFLTAHLLETYPRGDFLITDIAPEMVTACRERHGGSSAQNVHFAEMDGEAPDAAGLFDVIALSMTLQWFADPLTGLARLAGLLKPGGHIVYATLGPDGFPEWRAALAAVKLPDGTITMPELPGIEIEAKERVGYASGRDFLAGMSAIGASEPRPGYRPLPPGQLRRALRRLEQDSKARVTWHLAYGRIANA